MAKRSKRGFTALEVSVVVSMMLILVSVILPNLVKRKQSEADRAFRISLSRLAGQAREGAILDNRIYHLRMEGTQGLTLRKEDENGNVSTETAVSTVAIPEGTSAVDYVADGSNLTEGDWDLSFYPDGSSVSGSIAFERDQERFALNIDAKGRGEVGDDITDPTTESWDAGGYEQRQ